MEHLFLPSHLCPMFAGTGKNHHKNAYISEQLAYNHKSKLHNTLQHILLLNADQQTAFNRIYASTSDCLGKMFFFHGPGGTGRTFLYQTLCHCVHGNQWIVLCVVLSGIATLLLPGGQTAHSTFVIPVENLFKNSYCQIDKTSK